MKKVTQWCDEGLRPLWEGRARECTEVKYNGLECTKPASALHCTVLYLTVLYIALDAVKLKCSLINKYIQYIQYIQYKCIENIDLWGNIWISLGPVQCNVLKCSVLKLKYALKCNRANQPRHPIAVNPLWRREWFCLSQNNICCVTASTKITASRPIVYSSNLFIRRTIFLYLW